jgi:5-methylcytosine-specific restriction endonuclease McrA
MAQTTAPDTSTATVLTRLRAEVEVRQASLIREWADIATWAQENTVEGLAGAATIREGFVDTGLPIAGDGAPLVSEFALMELVAVLGRTPDGGRAYVGRVLGCAWRLPNVWAAVMAGRLAPWRAERISDLVGPLSAEEAAFVDRQLFNASGVGWAQLDRLIAEAIIRFGPERAEAEREAAADHRYFDIDEPNAQGLATITGLLDAADAQDLDDAVSRRATLLGSLGSEASLDVRRSQAVGELARADLMLDLDGAPARRATINVHITDTTLAGENSVARWNDRPISADQVREWLGTATSIVVRPVIDLAEHIPVDSYEIPDRHRVSVELRDHSCRFPQCGRQARVCDLDHARPHGRGGPTCPRNLVPLCRRHHRAKTHSRWRYEVLRPGTYQWTSPNGFTWQVDHRGTHPLRT